MSIWLKLLRMLQRGGIPCLFHEFTGLYCPGCGGTRAAIALLHGRVWLSFRYHPLILYCAAVGVWFGISYLIYWRTKNPKFRLYLGVKYVYVGVAIITVNFVVKNYFLIKEGIDLLERLPRP